MKIRSKRRITSFFISICLFCSVFVNAEGGVETLFGKDGYPPFPNVTQAYYIIYDEEFRNDRLEMVVFDCQSDVSHIVWDGALELNDNSNYTNDCKFYYERSTHSWVQFETGYRRISDGASNVYASNLDVWKDGSLYLTKTVYSTETVSRAYAIHNSVEYQPISASGDFSAAIKADNSLWTWGTNWDGGLGNGKTNPSYSPIKIMDDVAVVSSGFDKVTVIKTDGGLWGWGKNVFGGLGDGTSNTKYSPIKIMDDVKYVSSASYHTAAIKTDGSLWVWGYNLYGQLGDGTTEDRYNPIKIMDDVRAVSSGDFHTAAIKKDGSLWVWGSNSFGKLGDGTTDDSYEPMKIMENVVAVSVGNYNTAAIKNDGSLWVWGRNENGQLGNGTTDDSYVPIKIMEDVVAVSLGHNNTSAIKTDGSLWFWGYNGHGQLGNGTNDDSFSPVRIMDSVAAVSIGSSHVVAVKTDGSLWTWGNNTWGQLGNGSTRVWGDSQNNPIEIMNGIMLPRRMAPYIYDTIDSGDSVDISDKLNGVADEKSARNAVDGVAKELTDEQKNSATGIDKMTLLAEEAVTRASTKEIDNNIVHITESLIKDLESNVTHTTELLDEILRNNGIKTQRVIRKTVRVTTPKTGIIKLQKDAVDTSVDKVRVETDFASISMNAKEAAELSLESRGNNRVSIKFDVDRITTVKLSFPNISGDTTYMAVVDENGNAVGGKYNPATGEIEAKISSSGVYSVVNNEKNFADIKEKAAEMQTAIKVLAAKGIINGTAERTFSPDDSISRAEIAALVIRTLSKLDPNEDSGFADVTRDNWYFGVAGSSKKYGIVNGFDDNTFRGDAVVVKDQIVAISARVLRNEMQYKTPEDITEYLPYADASSIPEWAKEDIAVANMANLVMERTDNLFVADDEMTRGDAAIILYRLFKKIW